MFLVDSPTRRIAALLDRAFETPMIALETVNVTWSVPFASNTYSVVTSLEDSSGFLQSVGFSYLPNGAGVQVRIQNNDTAAAHQGYVHAIAQISQLQSGN